MKAVVLVGGFGTRLRPLTSGTPKQMLPVVDRPMIEWVVGHLVEHGIDDVVLSLGFAPSAFTEAYPDATCAGATLTYVVEDEPLDTAGAIRFAAAEAGIDERFLVLNGDVLTDLDVGALVDFHDGHGGEGTLHLIPVEDPSRYGVVPTEADGKVVEFVEKPPKDEAPSNWINAGTYVLEPSVLERISPVGRVSIERETFPAIAAEGGLYGFQSDTYWVDAGTFVTYRQIQFDLVDGTRSATLPAVAADAEVADGAKVDHSIVMAGAAVADGALVVDSVLHPGARVGAGATVRDSIVGAGAVVGADAVLENDTVLDAGESAEDGEHLDGVLRPEPPPKENGS
jgi:mannose-1-phosphate guanylyltransferase